jgi:DNA-binding FadR family transcriptional regulator
VVAETIRADIERGTWPPGATLPGIPTLAQHYGVTSDVLRRALTALRAEGLIDSRQGHHTRVLVPEQRRVVLLAEGDELTVRPPTLDERTAGRLTTGVALITIHRRRDGRVETHRSDQVIIRAATRP